MIVECQLNETVLDQQQEPQLPKVLLNLLLLRQQLPPQHLLQQRRVALSSSSLLELLFLCYGGVAIAFCLIKGKKEDEGREHRSWDKVLERIRRQKQLKRLKTVRKRMRTARKG
ncbi:hypothetical protein ACQ4LE_007712 [Meloidogyne hapla]